MFLALSVNLSGWRSVHLSLPSCLSLFSLCADQAVITWQISYTVICHLTTNEYVLRGKRASLLRPEIGRFTLARETGAFWWGVFAGTVAERMVSWYMQNGIVAPFCFIVMVLLICPVRWVWRRREKKNAARLPRLFFHLWRDGPTVDAGFG